MGTLKCSICVNKQRVILRSLNMSKFSVCSQDQVCLWSTSWRGPTLSGLPRRASCLSSGSVWTSLALGVLGCRRFSTRDAPCSVSPTSPLVFSVTSRPTTGIHPVHTCSTHTYTVLRVSCDAVVYSRLGEFRAFGGSCLEMSFRVGHRPLTQKLPVFCCPVYRLTTFALQKS